MAGEPTGPRTEAGEPKSARTCASDMPRWGASAAWVVTGMASAAEASSVIIFIFIFSPGEMYFLSILESYRRLFNHFARS